MDSPRQSKKANQGREPKRSQNQSSTPPQKDAYARLLSQHRSSKFSLYLEQYAKDLSCQREGNGPSTLLKAQSDRLNIPQRKRDQVPNDFSDSSDFSPSSLRNKGEESSLSLYMEKLSTRNTPQDCERKQGVSDRQRRGQRRDTATSHDGDVESGEELGGLTPNEMSKSLKQQKKNKDSKGAEMLVGRPQSPKKAGTSGQDQDKTTKSKKKNLPKHPEEEKSREGTKVDTQLSRPMSPHGKDKKMQQLQASTTSSPADKRKNKGGRGARKQVFESYMTSEEVSHGLKRGELIQGQLRINPKKYHEAFIPSPDDTWDIFLDGIVARNRALNGDIVVVQVLPQEQWKVVRPDTDCEGASESETQKEHVVQKMQKKTEHASKPDVVVEDHCTDQGGQLEDPQPHGPMVVYIVERKHSRAATGFLKFLPDKPFAMFSPVDHRVPRINVPLSDCPEDFSSRSGDYTNTLFICRITDWPVDNNFAEGRLAKTLGQAGEIEPETEGILTEYDVDFSEFSDEVLDCLPKNRPWTIPPEEMSKRRDLRNECIFTIDPATARDLDDALSCKQLPDGNFEVGVHIADVSYFVEEDNALDAVASQRATSVYMVQKVIPMLPRLLCEELCSLNPLTDRLTFSVIWKITPEGKILTEWFGRSVIRSCVKLSYDHAQSMIEAPEKMFSAEELPPVDPVHPIDEIHQAVLNLHSIAKNLRAQRFSGGALRLDQLKLSFTLDKETMMPQGCYIYQYRDSNKLVEEFMLLANIATANHIYRKFPDLALLRRHPPPKTKMVDELQELCDQLGINIDLSSAGALHKSLNTTIGDDDYSSARKEVLTHMCSRPMQMAMYFCTGELTNELLFKHYALNVPLYTHFTSPIRRYADIIVHRLLASSLKCGPHLGLSTTQVQKQASHCNDRKTVSKRVQELSSELFFGVFVKECGPLDSEAMVMGVLDQSFDVLVLRYGVQKRIYCKSLQSSAGLHSFQHRKVGKKSELTLVWIPEDPEMAPVEQVISIFTLVEVQLKADSAPMKYSAGEWVWVDSNIGVPIGARVKVTPSGQRLLVDDEGKEQSLSQEQEASLKIMHPTSVEGVDDMIKLGDMTEAGLLRNLLLRHKQGLIYTYTGSVLVAVNPYQDFPLYSADQVRLYHGRKLGELPPHIFAIAESCYFNMTRNLTNQCCIISGESGAGKTESTKLILQYLAAVSGELSKQRTEQQILESNPILEAFGNAKTIRNDNSSRFGKYLEIFFNKDGVIEGARVEQYLLEKSRVCHQAGEERNYHIFYCMLAGITTEERKALSLGNTKEYKFLTQGDCIICEGRDDAKDYSRICSAMKILTFSENQRQEILKLLAAMLHLGNVCFEATTQNNLETSDVGKSEHFSVAASLLEVKKSALATSLTHRSFMTNRERVTKPLSSEQAADCRDAFVKAIYNKLFIWIVEKINSVIYKNLAHHPKSSYLSIGLLDIFGFENFISNSFEQLCINFANEKLQQFFVHHIFKLEQEEYLKEGVMWNNINFSDNQNILDLLAGKSCNLLALIDEESHFPKGSDITMLNKINQQHSENGAYIASKGEYDTNFGIQHYAGVVYYDSRGFLEKNRDAISFDIIKTVEMSNNKLLHQIFGSELSNNGMKVANNKRVIMTPRSSLRAQNDKRKQMPTLSGQFRQSLDSLMKALSACQPFFIRCFKPNKDKQSQVFDRELCMRQLRYSGMMDTIRIRNLGFPVRHTFEDFLKRYRVLLKTTICDPKRETAAACCEAICKTVIRGEDEWKIGSTKIFLKDAHDAILERLREQELSRVAVVIQRVMLGHKDRKSFLKTRAAVAVLQKHWRAYRARKLKRCYERLISKIRGRKQRLQYQQQRAAAITIQTQMRCHWMRKSFKKKREAIILLQAYTRGFLARRAAQKTMNDATSHLRREEQEQIALVFQRGLEGLNTESNKESEPESEPEPLSEHDSEENSFDLQPAVEVVEQKTSESDFRTIKKKQITPEPAEETSFFTSSSDSEIIVTKPSTPTLSLEDEEDDKFNDDSSIYSFSKFSSLHFQGNATHTHIAQRLRQSLLKHDDEGDALACLTVWWIILRFMEDLPEPRPLDTVSQASSTISRLQPHKQGRRLSNLVGLDQKILRKNKKKHGGGTRRASAIPEEPENLTEDEDILIGEGPTLDRPLSALEKLHIITGYGLSRRDIRDEIYCQICKQLVNNKNRKSRTLGWTLLSICLGIFPPTDLFMQYLESFLHRGPKDYGEYCLERLHRTIANGERKELPCWIELEAAKTKKPIDVSVTLTDDRTISLHVNSASTSAEVCQTVADKLNLKDMYGFSLYISLYEKLWSLGSCGKHVLDAVSQCEQEMKRQGKQEKNAPWSLSLRKELFTPWHDCSEDPISTDLIYKQVIKGIKSAEYISEKHDEYIQLATKHYYTSFGSAISRENVQRVVEDASLPNL
ncbi:hypothetical protein INR49_000324 [Caranx melampygus]|nr:hypothetical protein INR49_000324 [Caranx melampygus]